MAMTVGELITALTAFDRGLPVGNADGAMLYRVAQSDYDDDDGTHDYVNLEMDDED